MAMALSPPWLWRSSSNNNNSNDSKSAQQQEDKGAPNRRFKARATTSAAKSSRRGAKQRQRRTSAAQPTRRSSSNSSPWKEARQVDEEFDMVVVPAEGCCLSGTESDDSDWSVGWMEPHSADFSSDSEDSFAVLVPCYGSSSPRLVATASNPPAVWAAALLFSSSSRNAAAEQRKYVEEWLTSLEEKR